ncbi:VCBS repeat-containing protein [Edaphobacter sp. HDX4]|uniref:FG-GAP-like repeat-containing protein n=1 Tax=Edaphobacter sp. HDX4 TaxID=2794064 RepID=UPI002FE5789E
MLTFLRLAGVGLLTLAPVAAMRAQTPSFSADGSFQGSSLTGWNTVGNGKWTASDGEITGTGRGLLVFDKPMQDTGVYLQFRCEGECAGGIFLRLEKTPDGMHGFLLSFEQELGVYRVTLDAEGKETERTKLRNAGGQIRFAPPAPPPGTPARTFRRPELPPMPAGTTSPLEHPTHGLRKDGWNEVEVLLDADILRAFFDDGGDAVSAATESMDGFGPFALYSTGSTIHFRAVAYKDLGLKTWPKEQVGSRFNMQRINEFYYGWSAAAADFNHDGKLDIVSGPFIYFGPEYTTSREIYPAQIVNASTTYSMEDWVEHAEDFTGDGWPDVLTTSHADGGKVGAVLYVNPKGESRRWEKYTVVAPIDSEETVLADVDGDGKQELVYMGGGYMCYAKPDPANPTKEWTVHKVSELGPWPAHGVGAGDVNGDHRVDIVGAYGWWEQPAEKDSQAKWKYHPAPFGKWGRTSAGGSKIGVYDVNGDGLPDVVTTMQAHGWGIDWFEQKRSASGEISFVPHVIMGRTAKESAGGVLFTEPHASTIADVDGDGIPDFVVGKRYWSHLDDFYDPDPYGAPVLYVYRTVRDKAAPGGARFVPELVHNYSGGGSDVLARDLNGDGVVDIVTSTRSGTYIFWGVKKPGKGALK